MPGFMNMSPLNAVDLLKIAKGPDPDDEITAERIAGLVQGARLMAMELIALRGWAVKTNGFVTDQAGKMIVADEAEAS